MEIFIASFIVFTVSGLALALGLLLWGRPMRRGCDQGGMNCQNACRKRHCPNKPDHIKAPPEA
jgi:hypothetical protein